MFEEYKRKVSEQHAPAELVNKVLEQGKGKKSRKRNKWAGSRSRWSPVRRLPCTVRFHAQTQGVSWYEIQAEAASEQSMLQLGPANVLRRTWTQEDFALYSGIDLTAAHADGSLPYPGGNYRII